VPDPGSPPSFFELGTPFSKSIFMLAAFHMVPWSATHRRRHIGCFSGGEYFVHLIACGVDEDLRDRRISIDSPSRFELLGEIRRKILETRCWEQDTALHFSAAGKTCRYTLRAQMVRRCFDHAFETTFKHIETNLQNPDKNSLLVIHGGSSLQPLFKEELLKKVRNSPVTTQIIHNGMIETSQAGEILRVESQYEAGCHTNTDR
jgi:hypothetical protein